MVGNEVTVWEMCQHCPLLHAKLHGKATTVKALKKGEEVKCSQCHTSLESILMGEPIGCMECYQIFQETLIKQLSDTNQISPRLKPKPTNQTSTLHLGKSPRMNENLFQSTRIRTLSESLNEALKGEDYEEAAWIRDQINTLMEKSNEQT